ncbi:DNA polymerase III subunit gamma/tau [Xylanibacter muris]|uniref:DNA polymerase III subunit gamma/tau n=1 Tax=Xylanibacter muris TaxID=2736290 RepID=A0ABX2ANH6_9BACT|nr:DNA polymerase III subunit gamma/tau [Xylanibacter muris]NPD92791.1 DNA polymerase III subunit gamma/tau [Xylanibacter muris]
MEEYIVSARKYRPASFDTVVGQSALTTTLKNAVKSGKLAHAYLFCGPRGVGKTTCARIFAKAINCQTPTSEGEACNECESCKAFNEQRSFNIFELDAASNNSVEHIKTLMEQTRIPPQVGRYKVFIIDEVHMLSSAAFNAFLKTLEEPPAHVIFILATTEKHKILPTILSRCQIYDFERMTVANTIAHLKNVAQKEGITYEDEALAVIAEKADGGMRDALSIFDQAASFCQGDITYKKVIEDLNVLDSDNYFKIVDLSLTNNVCDIMLLLDSIINKGFDGGLLIGGLAKHVRNIMMARDESTLPLLEVSEQQKEKFKEQASRCPLPFLYKSLKLMNSCDINYRQSGNKRLLVELTLIEIAQITQPDDSPVSGHGPKRLKTLFKNIILKVQPEKVARQVATADRQMNIAGEETVHRNPDNQKSIQCLENDVPQNGTQTAQNTTVAQYDKARRPVLKSQNGTIGFSWQNVRETVRKKKMQIIPGTLDASDPNAKIKDEQQDFTQHDVEYQWMAMCVRMPQKYSGIAARMKNMSPVITEFPDIEVTVDNRIFMSQMEEIKGSIQNTLRIYLKNNLIRFSLRLSEKKTVEKILTRREQFEKMLEDSPALEQLRQLLDLEMA